MDNNIINTADTELYELLLSEEARQKNTLDMVASESLQDTVSLALSGSVFCNKTAVGLPGKQRLGGSEYADQLESLAASRACSLFGAEYANVLPYSGTVANLCVYNAVLEHNDTVLALHPDHGSHASHGRSEHISAKLYHFVHFGLHPATHLIDYDEIERLLDVHHPKLIVVGVSAYSRLIDFERIAKAAHKSGAVFMVDMAHLSGLVAARVIPNPVAFADIVTASGTKTMCSCHTGYILCRKKYAAAIDASVYPGVTASVHLQTVASAAWAFKRGMSEEFRMTMRQTVHNAKALCDALIRRGFGILTGGTDTHMFVADLRPLGEGRIHAVEFCDRLERIGISTNTKSIPQDDSPEPNGIRVGCTVLTQRGMKEEQMENIADIFALALNEDEASFQKCRSMVAELCDRYTCS